jgi:methylated-DNA-[protein]-cysteine S-methyltransferase
LVETLHLERFDTPTGPMLVVTDRQHRVRAAQWQDHESRMARLLRRHYPEASIQPRAASHVSPARRALQAYFDGDLDAISDVPTATHGTDFQRQVWAALRLIPAGCTISYGALAAKLGRPKAVRAVGLANGANPVPIVVPCHRVIGADASLTGYGGGLDRKRWLLAHERAGRPAADELICASHQWQ